MKQTFTLTAALAATFLSANILNAQVTLDDFNAPLNIPISVLAPATVTSQTMVDPSVLGGERDIVITKTSSSGDASLVIEESSPGSNSMVLSSSLATTSAIFEITYDGVDNNPLSINFSPGLGGLDLSGTGEFGADLFVTELSNGNFVTVTFRVYTDDTQWSEGVINFSGTISNDIIPVSIAAGSFITGSGASGPASFSDVNVVQITVSTNQPGFLGRLEGGIVLPDPGVPLPITLSKFDARIVSEQVALTWVTESEQNNNNFDIERSVDGKQWRSVGMVYSQAEDGNSSASLQYSYTDIDPLAGKSLYRLKQTDFDGNFSYSDVRMIHFDRTTNIAIYPNPVMDNLHFSGVTGLADLYIYDLTGNLIQVFKNYDSSRTIPVNILSNGTYVLTIIEHEGKSSQHKFIKN